MIQDRQQPGSLVGYPIKNREKYEGRNRRAIKQKALLRKVQKEAREKAQKAKP